MIDWSAITEAGLAALSAIALGVAFYVRTTARSVIGDEIEEAIRGKIQTKIDAAVERAAGALYLRINDHEGRVVHIETALDDLPKSRDVHDVSLKVAELLGELKGMRGEMEAIKDSSNNNRRALERIEQWALDNAKAGGKK